MVKFAPETGEVCWTYRIADVCSWYHARIKEQGEKLYEHVHPKEHDDLLPTHCRVFRANVVNHDCGHAYGNDVHKTCC
jgi:hypothetical protein